RDELLDQPALPLAGLTLDDNHLPPPALGPLPRGCQRRELSAPSAQGRARPRGWRRREHAAAHARIPDAVGEPRGIGPRRGPDLRPERVAAPAHALDAQPALKLVRAGDREAL